MSINRVVISGNLTRDPELRATASGMPVLGFGVAVNDRRKNQQTGEWEDYPNFIDCTMFGARAESVSRFCQRAQRLPLRVNFVGASGNAMVKNVQRSKSLLMRLSS